MNGSAASALERPLQPDTQIRVAIVDDDPDIRFLVSAWVRADARLALCGEAHDGESAIDLATRERPSVMILDVMMPGMGGVEAAPRIRVCSPTTRIIFFTAHPVVDHALGSVDAIVSKGDGKEHLLAALFSAVGSANGGSSGAA